MSERGEKLQKVVDTARDALLEFEERITTLREALEAAKVAFEEALEEDDSD